MIGRTYQKLDTIDYIVGGEPDKALPELCSKILKKETIEKTSIFK